MSYHSWGRVCPPAAHGVRLVARDRPLPAVGQPWLARGNGRSYADSGLEPAGCMLDCRGLDRFIAFDAERGILRCEAGVLLDDVLQVIVPRGWFLPVTPGTRYVTVGGAIANDVHGKNHHRAGTFGRHLRAFELLRSDGSRLTCGPAENPGWFAATIGGLGLTGLVSWAELALRRIDSRGIDATCTRFETLDEFLAIADGAVARHEYTVAWLDASPRRRVRVRGHFTWGDHVADGAGLTARRRRAGPAVPFAPPWSLVTPLTTRVFNTLYFHRQRKPVSQRRVDYEPFFYPLDGVREWNRLYGRPGFAQYQCVVPRVAAADALPALLGRLGAAGAGSFLAVLKTFGDTASPGLLSFPRAGVTLAVDIPWRGEDTQRLFAALDAITLAAGGTVYAAKNGSASAACFRASTPALERFRGFVDPACSSAFWRAVEAAA